jgi:rare lipoprotein A
MLRPPLCTPLRIHNHLLLIAVALLITACGTATKKPDRPTPTQQAPTATKPSGTATKPGGYYLDDGPGADPIKNTPAYLESIADATPRQEKFHSGANRPYTVFGKTYVPTVNNAPFRETGIASWYGRKFHGNMTSIGEIYDMYAMTAAHPTLPLPSYVRVTNPANQKSVVVRVNDRGPFHESRVIDLSFAAAHRLDIARRGSAPVVVERVFAQDSTASTNAQNTSARPVPPVTSATPPTTTAAVLSPITPEGAQLFLQLGAFSTEQSAAVFRDRMARELDWNREPIAVILQHGLWRVRMGPYATQTEALAIQARVRESHDFSPVIAKP